VVAAVLSLTSGRCTFDGGCIMPVSCRQARTALHAEPSERLAPAARDVQHCTTEVQC